MGKYAKIALVLLYVAQLGIAFREQLTHFYKEAIEIVQRETAHLPPPGDTPMLGTFFKRKAPAVPGMQSEAIADLPRLSTLTMAIAHPSGDQELHEEDEYKDRARRTERPKYHERLIRSLVAELHRIAAPPSAQAAHGSTTLRLILAPESPRPV